MKWNRDKQGLEASECCFLVSMRCKYLMYAFQARECLVRQGTTIRTMMDLASFIAMMDGLSSYQFVNKFIASSGIFDTHHSPLAYIVKFEPDCSSHQSFEQGEIQAPVIAFASKGFFHALLSTRSDLKFTCTICSYMDIFVLVYRVEKRYHKSKMHYTNATNAQIRGLKDGYRIQESPVQNKGPKTPIVWAETMSQYLLKRQIMHSFPRRSPC